MLVVQPLPLPLPLVPLIENGSIDVFERRFIGMVAEAVEREGLTYRGRVGEESTSLLLLISLGWWVGESKARGIFDSFRRSSISKGIPMGLFSPWIGEPIGEFSWSRSFFLTGLKLLFFCSLSQFLAFSFFGITLGVLRSDLRILLGY